MEQEIEFLDRNQTRILVDLPKDSKVIDCRWVFRKKDNEQYKARLVAKGYTQKEGIDYNEIFSPVVKHTSIRMLAIVAQFDLELEQLDVKTTFLHGELEAKIYMKQPEGYIQEGHETMYVFSKNPSMNLSSLPGSGTNSLTLL